jgi:hypothetical protein
MATGGTLVNPRRRPANDSALRELSRPSTTGASVQKGESHPSAPATSSVLQPGSK